ncbi:uncharacterized protein LOC126881153 isoform X4 [Diabrotica virgifera virgifera]|uniref:Uncharacterized protein n=1 Tax=Diabrotica virgifera virgifera TaxID=50390 RepID=A0ABM5JTB7_DIAVI|nr:uncharacterized protein LOC126881153 isoform X4 [Diabrotica virgifera virgifera]
MHDCLCPSTPTAERRKPITTSSKNTSCFTTSDNNCNNNCSRCDILYSCTNFPDKSISHYTTATGEDCSCLNCVCSEMEIQNQTCDCVTCVCSVCFENGKKAPYTTYIPSTTCDCQNCVCSVCPSPAGQPKDRGDKGITAPRSGLQPIEQSKGQTYSFCKCLTCDVDGREPNFHNPQLECNCNICKCSPCTHQVHTEHTQKVHTEHFVGQPMGHTSSFCKCLTCDVDGREPNFHNPQLECNCNICKCSPCTHKVHTEHTQKVHTEHFVDKTRNCNCVTCTCSPCDFPNSAQQALNCQCIVCQCSLCQLTNDQLPVSPLMPCNCTVCKCNPCGDPNKYRDQIDHEPHLAGCDCLTCTCNPCADPAVQRSKQPDQLIQEAGHPQQFGAHEMKNCNCVQCCCKGSTAEQREKKVDATDEEVPCSCPICMCKKDKNTHGKGDEIYADEKMVESKYKSTPSSKCTCETCRCGDGTKQLAKTDVPIQITRSIHDRDCICKECLCEELQKTSTIEFVKCHCSTCNCVDCLFRQPEPQRKIQDRTITKIPTHCTCRDKMANECICKECKSFSDVSTELDDKATNSLCSCSACSCLTCHTKKVENIENMKCYCEKCKCENCKFIKYQTREFNIKEELGDNKNLCTCSPCSCTDCVLNNKIEGKAIKNNNPCPILEAKCTCVEIPMSQPTRIEQQSEYVPNVPKMKQHHSYAAYHAFVDPIHVHKKLQNLTSLPETEKIKAAKGQKIEAENLYNYLPILLPQSAMPVRTQAKRKKNYKSSKSKKARGLTRSAELSRFKQFGLSRSKPIPYSEEVFPVSQSDVTNNRTIFHQLDPNLPEKPYDLTGNNKSFLKDKCKYEEQIKILKKTLNKIKGLKEKYAHNSHKRSVFKKSCEYEESISEISTAFKNLKKHCKADDKTIKELTEELKRYTSSTTFFNISTSVQQESEYDHTVTELSVDIQQQFPCYNPLRTSVPNIPVVQQETVKIRPATATLGQRRRGNICDCALCTNAHPDIYSNTGYKISSRHSKLIRTINYDTFNKPNTLSHNLALTCKEDKRESEFPPYYILQPYCLTKENIPVECENHHETEMINAPDFVQPAAGLNETVNTWRNKCATDNANDIKMTKNVETQSFDRPKFNGVACKCGKYHKDNRFVNLTGFKVINVKRITVDSIVVEWKCPKSKAVTGYDIEINGKQKSKILSGWRTCAMIHSVDLSSVLYISIYAITPCGRCEPPAKAIYEIKQKSK